MQHNKAKPSLYIPSSQQIIVSCHLDGDMVSLKTIKFEYFNCFLDVMINDVVEWHIVFTLCVCVCACVRACVCVHACVSECVRACVYVCACTFPNLCPGKIIVSCTV